MISYFSYGVKLSNGQQVKLARAYKYNTAIVIRLHKNELTGPHVLMLAKT